MRISHLLFGMAIAAVAVPATGQGTTTGTPGPIDVVAPAVSGRAVYVTQIGEANVAQVTQTAANAEARLRQDGDRNRLTVVQAGTGSAYAEITQTGSDNEAGASQQGGGQNILYLAQTGTGNRAVAQQAADGTVLNGAILTQAGSFNDMSLTQEGEDNRAVLTQEGSNNDMTAAQSGFGNRLVWTQQGNNLPNLGVTQTGNQAIQITQSGPGN